MAEIVAILTTSWKLISAIREVVNLFEQTREDGRALQVQPTLPSDRSVDPNYVVEVPRKTCHFVS